MFNAGFVLGFVVALAVVGIIGRLVGAARLARVFGALAGRPRTAKCSTNAPALVPTPLEADVIAALVNLKATPAAAQRATADAAQYLRRYKVAPAFEPLFNAAVASLRGNAKAAA